MTMYVETYRPALQRRVRIRVHRTLAVENLDPSMTAVFEVQGVRTNEDAIACVVERAAGYGVSVRLLMGGRT